MRIQTTASRRVSRPCCVLAAVATDAPGAAGPPLRRAPRAGRGPAGGAAAPAGLAAVAQVHPAAVPDAGQRVGHRSADLPVLHPDAPEPVERRRLGALRRAGQKSSSTTSSACGRRTSSTTSGSRCKDSAVRQRRDGQGSQSSTWKSASASRSSTTTGSKMLEQTKIEEKLRDESVQIRLDSFIDEGAHPAGRRRHPRHVRREGLRVRQGDPHDS